MAKKNLINADMLLATPRKAPEPTPQEVIEPVVVAPQQTIISPAIVSEPEIVQPTPSVKKGLKGNETRATFIVDENLVEKLKAVAYWERLNIKDVINDAFQSYLDNFEKSNGTIKPVPSNRKA